ncbi:MAG: cadherin domain-containing protein, partial [Flavobacteriaceae bacterium]
MNSTFWISDWNFFKLTIRYSWFLLFLFAIQISSGQVNTNGLVLHLDANNSSSYSGSGNTWNDISGNNYHVNFFNGVQFRNTNETIPKYFEFNGTSHYGAITNMHYDSANSLGELSVFAWVKTTYSNGTDGTWDNNNWSIIDFDRSEWYQLTVTGAGQISFSGDNTNQGGLGTNGDHFDMLGTNGSVNDGNWHYIGYTYSVSSQKVIFYLDGQVDKTYTANGSMNALADSTTRYGFIGDGSEAGSYNSTRNNIWYQGSIGAIHVYHRALTANEVSQNYSSATNYAPTDITLSATAFNENLPSGTHVASLTATDQDNNDTHSFTLASGNGTNDADNNYFTIQGASLKTSGTFDFETKSSYNIYINTNDGAANYAKAFTVTVSDVNDVPDDISFSSIISDNLILHLDASNSNSYPGNGNTWYDISGNGHNFTLNGATYNNNGYFDFDGDNDWARTVSSLDLSSYDKVTVQIYFKTENTNALECTYEHSINWNNQTGGFGLFAQSAGSSFNNSVHHTNQKGGFSGNSGRNYQFDILNDWHLHTNIHSMAVDATGRQTYIDNNLIPFTSSPYPNTTATVNGSFSNHHFYIGARQGNNYYLNGQVKSLLIYGSKLNQIQVAKNYQAIISGSSISTLTLDEGSSVGSLVGTLSATGKDAGETLTYSLVSNGQSSS